MRRGGALVFLVIAAIGLVAFALQAAADKRDLAFTLGVVPSIVAADLRPGVTACQVPIDVPTDFSRIRLRAGSPGGPGQPLVVSVIGNPSGRLLTEGRLPGGYPYATDQAVSVGHVESGQKIGVCVRNAGTRRAVLYGNTLVASPLSGAIVGHRALKTDISVVFLKDGDESMLGQLGQVFERASVFRPGFVGAWLYWVLAAAVLVGVPLLLARALADSDDASPAA